ncbi:MULTISPECIES: MobC family plasmid mobilization relaxosome protein [unclassified Clostridium]|jgi:vacuolar-type H+-ATPase subunit I/STV1|uniref:MobC family plasmid mobilization relaxosome protein n=1 Tax=unclassified Clostridium TaxID=2614128 RepID=UPI003F922843
MNKEKAEEIIESVQGNMKHEDMILTDEEKELLMEYVLGNITREEYIEKSLEDVQKSSIRYEIEEEKIIDGTVNLSENYKVNRKRNKQIVIRATEKELNTIKNKVRKSNLSQNEYLLKCALDKKILVVDGLKDLNIELKRIGNNLNQLTKSVHEGKTNCSKELLEINEEMKEVWQLLRQLTPKVP